MYGLRNAFVTYSHLFYNCSGASHTTEKGRTDQLNYSQNGKKGFAQRRQARKERPIMGFNSGFKTFFGALRETPLAYSLGSGLCVLWAIMPHVGWSTAAGYI
jgi:hypothetical protein